nr:hypothetical protein [Fulvimarina manganoxydans]
MLGVAIAAKGLASGQALLPHQQFPAKSIVQYPPHMPPGAYPTPAKLKRGSMMTSQCPVRLAIQRRTAPAALGLQAMFSPT